MKNKTIRFRKLHVSITLLCTFLLASLWMRLLTSPLEVETLIGKVFLISFYVLSISPLTLYILVSVFNWHYVEISEKGISVYSFPFRLQPKKDFVGPFDIFYIKEYHIKYYGYIYDVLGKNDNSNMIIVSELEKNEAQAVVNFLNESIKV